MYAANITQLIDSMENTIKLQSRARAQRRAEDVEREKSEFYEKLRQSAVSKMDLDSTAAKIKGDEEAVRRDQLMGLMMAGF